MAHITLPADDRWEKLGQAFGSYFQGKLKRQLMEMETEHDLKKALLVAQAKYAMDPSAQLSQLKLNEILGMPADQRAEVFGGPKSGATKQGEIDLAGGKKAATLGATEDFLSQPDVLKSQVERAGAKAEEVARRRTKGKAEAEFDQRGLLGATRQFLAQSTRTGRILADSAQQKALADNAAAIAKATREAKTEVDLANADKLRQINEKVNSWRMKIEDSKMRATFIEKATELMDNAWIASQTDLSGTPMMNAEAAIDAMAKELGIEAPIRTGGEYPKDRLGPFNKKGKAPLLNWGGSVPGPNLPSGFKWEE